MGTKTKVVLDGVDHVTLLPARWKAQRTTHIHTQGSVERVENVAAVRLSFLKAPIDRTAILGALRRRIFK